MSLDRISKRLKEIAEALVTVRTGTVASHYAAMEKTMVILDNDPSRTPVVARCLHRPVPAGLRVTLLAYPVGGLVIIGAMELFTSTELANSAIARASGALTLTTTAQDIPGASVTITTQIPNSVVVVHGVLDVFSQNTTANEVALGILAVDDVNQSGLVTYETMVPGATVFRFTVAQNWQVVLPTPGAHTLKLRASRSGVTAGTIQVQATHTSLLVTGYF